ncbi:MAG: 50S ribosomal protein L20 [Patescibacteria group bacterium]
MVRIKGGQISQKRRKNILDDAKGFRWRRKSTIKGAKTALMHAWEYSYRDRKTKKRVFRRLWEIQINAGCRKFGLPYNQFASALKKNKIGLDRKILSNLAQSKPEIFEKIVKKVKG